MHYRDRAINFTSAVAKAGRLSGEEHLFFFDAIAPIVTGESINMKIAFHGSRYSRGEPGEGDYVNCPLSKPEYDTFIEALLDAERINLHSFEEAIKTGVAAGHFFEGCLPVEILAERGRESSCVWPNAPGRA